MNVVLRYRPRPGGRWGKLFTPNALIVALGAAAVTLAVVWYWRLWDGGIKGPLAYQDDALLYQRLARTVAQKGWYLVRNPLLGAPTGQILYDYPLGTDNVHLLLFRLFAVGTSNPFVITNLSFLLSFPLAYLTCCYSLRRLHIATLIAVPLSVLYALAPYHFLRGVTHLFLSGYFAVPLGCLLLYELLAHAAMGSRSRGEDVSGDPPPTVRAWVRSREFWWGRWLWVPVLIGSTGAYYAFFFIFFAIAIGLLSALGGRAWRTLARSAVVAAVTLMVMVVNNAPTLVYRAQHGTNDVVGQRSLGDADIFALQPAYLLLPVVGHRIPFAAELRARADKSVSPIPSVLTMGLGATAAAGLVLSVAALVTSGRKRRNQWREVSRSSGILNLLALFLGCAGGAYLILGIFGFVQLRDYSRLSIFMAFFSLAALGAYVQPLFRRVPLWLTRRKVVVGVVSSAWRRASRCSITPECEAASPRGGSCRAKSTRIVGWQRRSSSDWDRTPWCCNFR